LTRPMISLVSCCRCRAAMPSQAITSTAG
jgi:hypothetical protein